ncbi:serine/threonine protein kinase [Xylographa opegraphella]|nr:serine/threonine protein kinase [Xylographa opegraphella]
MDPSNPSPVQGQTATGHNDTHAVRFSSKNQEIEPEQSLHTIATLTSDNSKSRDTLSPEAQAELRMLSKTLQESHLQHGRMSNFAFEPVSLPVSRAPSNEPSPRRQLADGTRSGLPSPRGSSSFIMQSPPLTPAVSSSRDEKPEIATATGGQTGQSYVEPTQMTPQTSGPSKTPPHTAADGNLSSDHTSLSAGSRPPSSSGQPSTRPTTLSSESGIVEALPKQTPLFIPGPSGDSLPVSRDQSPSSTPAPGSGTVTPTTGFTRPFTPSGDHDDPYARSKRPPQSRNLDAVEPRFIFGGKDSRRASAISTTALNLNTGSLPRSSSGADLKASQDKHKSMFAMQPLAGHKDHHGHLRDDNSSAIGKSHGSMSDLKRFLRFGHSHKDKRSQSPAPSAKSSLNNKSGTRTPPRQLPPSHVPFADDHGLESKYGKFGKVLGSGAGGSVRLLKRSGDGVTFAVKQFRERHSYESERDYNKKVTAEFCIGSTLHHGNIIETLDIIQERGRWYEVMEYAPFDLFAMVMTGKMSREEIACSFLQIFAGVTYLHSMGLAHRDLKLDNVVVNEFGIMKLIDFGSACVFRYPFENDIVLASGVVGSDPYLAPEVYDNTKYDPQPADIWSLAIIFACMSLRRFPWKAPRISDNSYKLFISPPSPGTPSENGVRRTSEQRPKSMMDLSVPGDDARRKSAPHSEGNSPQVTEDESRKHSHHNQHQPEALIQDSGGAATPETSSAGKQEVIKGPWRLLRLLPRESRTIIGRMLEINPMRRATIEEMLADPWVSGTPVCTQIEGGKVIKAPGHEHTLEPSSPDPPTPVRR